MAECARTLRGEPHCGINGDVNAIQPLPVGHKYGVCRACYERAPQFYQAGVLRNAAGEVVYEARNG